MYVYILYTLCVYDMYNAQLCIIKTSSYFLIIIWSYDEYIVQNWYFFICTPFNELEVLLQNSLLSHYQAMGFIKHYCSFDTPKLTCRPM